MWNDAQWMLIAEALEGQAEIPGKLHNPVILEMFRVSGQDFETDETAWCMAAVNSCFLCSGWVGTNSALASSAMELGRELSEPVPGCLVVFHPLAAGASGHVGFYLSSSGDTIKVLGGNQGNAFKQSSFPKNKVRSYRWPTVRTAIPQTTLPTLYTLGVDTGEQKPIVLPPKQDNFLRCHEQGHVAQWEGGYSDDVYDKGKQTKYGITIGTLSDYNGRPASVDEVKALTYGKALEIFRKNYWTPVRGDELPIALALLTYNTRVMSGPKDGERFLQKALNKFGASLDVDGEIGPLTLQAAWDTKDVAAVVADYHAQNLAYLKTLDSWAHFGKGWKNRLDDLKSIATKWAKESPMPTTTSTDDALKQILEAIKGQQAAAPPKQPTFFERLFGMFSTPSNAAIAAAGAGAVATPMLQKADLIGSIFQTAGGSGWATLIGTLAGMGLFGRFSTFVSIAAQAVDELKKLRQVQETKPKEDSTL